MDSTILIYSGGVIGLLSLFYLFNAQLRNRNIELTTALKDLPHIGVPRSGQRIRGTAVICGGSIGGLWAARVCADHFDDVVIVEPEIWLNTEEGRATYSEKKNDINNGNFKDTHARMRVMQYNALHGFQPFAIKAIRKIFPYADDEFRKSDAKIRPAMFNTHINGLLSGSLPYEDYSNGDVPVCYFSTRGTFEKMLRRLVYKPGGRIRWLTGTITGLKQSATDKRRIESVTVRTDGSNKEKTLEASLVIDCSGGTQAGFKWIKRLFAIDTISKPFDDYRDSYNPRLRYMTFKVVVPTHLREKLPIPEKLVKEAGFLYVFVPQPPNDHRSIILNEVEGDQIQFCCGGWGDPVLPKTFDEMIEYVKSFHGAAPVPDWVAETIEILKVVEEEADIDGVKVPPCSWIHYEKMNFLPYNYISMGDATMRVNPIFGQGCTKALLGAMTLNNILRISSGSLIPDDFSKRFFKLQCSRIKPLWDGTKPIDYGFATTIPVKGETLHDGYLMRKYGEILTLLSAQGDKKINSTLWHVRNFLAPPSDMLNPIIVLKVLFFCISSLSGIRITYHGAHLTE